MKKLEGQDSIGAAARKTSFWLDAILEERGCQGTYGLTSSPKTYAPAVFDAGGNEAAVEEVVVEVP